MSPASANSQGPARVAASEAELLTVARTVVGGASQNVGRWLLQKPRGTIRKIGPTAMGLLQQTLARGVCQQLLRRGGWQQRRTLVDGVPKRGRLWQRHGQLPALRFGPASFELLVWLHSDNATKPRRELPRHEAVGLGDELLHYLAAEQILEVGGRPRQEAFLRSPLCQLGFADQLASDAELPRLDFAPYVRGDGALILEALQSELARRWLAMEEGKGNIVELDAMVAVGRAQTQVLDGLFAAIEASGDPKRDGAGARRELAGFLAEAAVSLLARGRERLCPAPRWWTQSLDLRAPLAARQQAFTAAAAFLHGVARLGEWVAEAGVVAHFEADYEAAQLLLSSWHALHARPEGPADAVSVLERAAALARALDSLHSLGASSN